MSANDIKVTTTVDGIEVDNMNDQALFARIASVKAELKSLTDMGIGGPAVEANATKLKAKIEDLTALVNARYDTAAAE
jgi:hypothetical protein